MGEASLKARSWYRALEKFRIGGPRYSWIAGQQVMVKTGVLLKCLWDYIPHSVEFLTPTSLHNQGVEIYLLGTGRDTLILSTRVTDEDGISYWKQKNLLEDHIKWPCFWSLFSTRCNTATWVYSPKQEIRTGIENNGPLTIYNEDLSQHRDNFHFVLSVSASVLPWPTE